MPSAINLFSLPRWKEVCGFPKSSEGGKGRLFRASAVQTDCLEQRPYSGKTSFLERRRFGFHAQVSENHIKNGRRGISPPAVWVCSKLCIHIINKLIGNTIFCNGVTCMFHFPGRQLVQVGEEGVCTICNSVYFG